MTFFFFLSKNASAKNIHLKLIDEDQNINFTFRLALRIDKNDWDIKKQRPVNIYLKKYKNINRRLNEIKLSLTSHINKKLKKKAKLTQKGLLKEIHKICSIEKILYTENSLLYFVQHYIKSKKDIICNTTYKRYNVFFGLIQRFEGYMGERLYIDKIDMEVISSFIRFGKNEEYSESTIYRTIHFIKTILNFAERKNIRTNVAQLNNIRFEKQKKEVIVLSEKEILKIKNAKIPKSLQTARDWLLISCYTGQRISDFMRFSTDKIVKINDRYCLNFIQQKTKKEITLPLHPTVLRIIQQNRCSFPKQMDMHKYNEHIKEIARICNLDELIKAKKRVGYRSKIMEIEKWQLITSHIGRRSFATNFYGKIPTALLMEATGHCSEQMFLKYIALINKDRILSLSNYFNEVYKERNIKAGLSQKRENWKMLI